ncbi:hypothetical protein DUZ99_14895 [Xylanibacillus composti]|uniref:Uncharacterized protein n=1 Tax=Xylanibacillus composti TaxID=1572762 RepID=A0A8J4H812_9BACL|nr:hypothetical protein [Xylanibacillus composti]MDT9726267.1 hypothetical protein [Xylanibacillus composti]GIQ70704.1 hypothetical protein XYCOK13_35280 [Xylanibacillus composti]
MRFRRDRLFWYVIIGLIVIGIVSQLRQLLIPVVVLGTIFLLYKFPPHRWKRSSGQWSSRKHRAKKAKFRVIDGSGREDNDNDTPRYH